MKLYKAQNAFNNFNTKSINIDKCTVLDDSQIHELG